MNIFDILNEIESAYPDDIFPDTTQDERDPIIEQYPGFIDRTSAMMGRHLAKVIREKLSQPPDEDMPENDAERGDRLEAMVDRMAGKLSECTLLIWPMYDLCQQIEICGASVELTKAVTMASDIMHKLMDATGNKQLPPKSTKKKIEDVRCICPKCTWVGTVYECEPDVDGDGSLGCPKCGAVVKCEDV